MVSHLSNSTLLRVLRKQQAWVDTMWLQYTQQILFRGTMKVPFQLKTVTFRNPLLGDGADSSAGKAVNIPYQTKLFIYTRYPQKHLSLDSRPLTFGLKTGNPQEKAWTIVQEPVGATNQSKQWTWGRVIILRHRFVCLRFELMVATVVAFWPVACPDLLPFGHTCSPCTAFHRLRAQCIEGTTSQQHFSQPRLTTFLVIPITVTC